MFVVACGALVKELRAVFTASGLDGVELTALPAPLHNHPERITSAVADTLDASWAADRGPVVLGYADCGTGGHLDTEIERRNADGWDISRLPGAHCYEFFAGSAAFRALHDEELGTFFLTDFLARNFEQLIWKGFRLDRHPELVPMMFGNYRRVVHLAQTDDPAQLAELERRARLAAEQLGGLRYERRATGLTPLTERFVELTPTARDRSL